MNADGSDQVNLTVRPLDDDSPAWAPDGVRLAFVSNRDGDAEIYVIDTQFSDLTRVTDGRPRRCDAGLVAGRDAPRLHLEPRPEPRAVRGERGRQRPEAADERPGLGIDARWSPDGSRIAFASFRDGRRDIYTIAPDGTDLTRLTNDESEPVPQMARCCRRCRRSQIVRGWIGVGVDWARDDDEDGREVRRAVLRRAAGGDHAGAGGALRERGAGPQSDGTSATRRSAGRSRRR